jgi:hypothetical protein
VLQKMLMLAFAISVPTPYNQLFQLRTSHHENPRYSERACCILLSAPAMAEVYQYVDANGKTVFLISRRQGPRQSS